MQNSVMGASPPETMDAQTPRRRAWRWPVGIASVCLLATATWLLIPQVRGWYHLREAHQALAALDLDRADEHLEQCLRIWPRDAELHLLVAQTARRRGDLDTADKEFAICGRLAKTPPGRSLELTLRQAQAGNLSDVEERLRKIAGHDGSDRLLALEALAQGYMENLRFMDAAKCTDAILKDWPDHFSALLWRGRINEYHDDYQAAVTDYELALHLHPHSDTARERYAENLERLGRLREATAQWELLYQRQPHLAEVALHLARSRHDAHDLSGCDRLLEELLSEQPDNVRALVERSRLAIRQGQAARAEPWLRRAVACAPADRDAQAVLRLCLEHEGKTAEAAQCAERVRQIEIESTHLAALKRQALRLPRDPALRVQIGVLLLKRGDTAEGLHWLRSALHVEPGYGPAQEALAAYSQRRGSRS